MIFFRPSLLLENYQPWLDLKISSKVDASLSEVTDLINIAVYTQAQNVRYLMGNGIMEYFNKCRLIDSWLNS